MKAIIMALAVCLMTALGVNAQQGICLMQHPTIVAKGHFNNGLVNATTTKTFKAADLPLYTKLDTVNGSSGVDTFKCQLVGDYNSVLFQWNLTKIGGRVDSFTVTYWASVDGSNYVSLGTATATNTAGTKAYSYIINSGTGNPYGYYMLTAACTNAAVGSSGSWRGYALPR